MLYRIRPIANHVQRWECPRCLVMLSRPSILWVVEKRVLWIFWRRIGVTYDDKEEALLVKATLERYGKELS